MRNSQDSTLKTNWPMVAISPQKPYLCSKSLKEMSEELKPYSIEEINAMLDEAERESAAGLGQDSEEMFRELEEELSFVECDNSELASSYESEVVTAS